MSGLNGDWYEALKGEFSKPYYRKLFETVNEEYRTKLDLSTGTGYFQCISSDSTEGCEGCDPWAGSLS